MTHREFCELFAYNKNTAFVEVNLGSKWLQNPQIADVINIRESYTRFCIDIYECKLSRSDLMKDIKKQKYLGYLENSHRFYYVINKGVSFLQGEIPDEAGIIIMGNKGFKTIRRAKPRNVEIPEMTLLALLFYRTKFMDKTRYYSLQNSYYNWTNISKKNGKEISKAMAFYNKYKDKIQP